MVLTLMAVVTDNALIADPFAA